jgi:hypothetical protein
MAADKGFQLISLSIGGALGQVVSGTLPNPQDPEIQEKYTAPY